MKVAILHEMLVKLGGAEKVVQAFLEAFPESDLFTLIYDEKNVGNVFPKSKINKQVFNLKSQKRYKWTKNQRLCLGVMAESVESLDFSGYDIVLCSSSGFAHGAITKPETKFIVYYHSPAGYMWHETHNYMNMILKNKNFISKFLLKSYLLNFLNKLRIWDFEAGQRNDLRIAASIDSKKRIKKYYRQKDIKILYPPVEVDKFNNNLKKQDYYISVGMLTESKNFEFLIEVFNDFGDEKLQIIGDGHLKKILQNKIKNKNIKILGYKSGEELYQLIGKAKGAIFAGIEDFGIAAIESMAGNTPVLGLNKGGYKETIIPGKTGELFDLNKKDFIKRFKIFRQNINSGIYKQENLEKQAKKFSKQKFIREIKKIVENV